MQMAVNRGLRFEGDKSDVNKKRKTDTDPEQGVDKDDIL